MKVLFSSLVAAIALATQVTAVPWCHKGTVVTVATVSWSGATASAVAGAITAPPGHPDPERYQIFHATDNYCQSFAGGGGPMWGPIVPGAGTVTTQTTGPNVLTNTVNDYSLAMGVTFRCKKCYATPPYVQIHELAEFKPFGGLEIKEKYERKIARGGRKVKAQREQKKEGSL